MNLRLLDRLDAAIAAAKQPLQADCLRAERAGALARCGQLDEARQLLSTLHMQYASRPHVVMSAWLSWGEGLLSYFSDMGAASHDRMRRAYALSGAARDMPLHALCAAWLAHMDYNEDDFQASARHVGEALRLAAPDDHATRARACLVVAYAYHFAGRFDLGQPWYTRARQHIVADGDDISLSALMHNMTALHAGVVRQTRCTASPGEGRGVSQILMGAESTRNFDRVLGTNALDSLGPILCAQVLSLHERHEEALALYDEHYAHAMAQGLGRMQANLRADMAWCRLRLAQHSRALQDARAAARAVEDPIDIDDRAAAHSLLALVFAELGEADTAARHAERAALDWKTHVATQYNLVALLNQAVDGV
ncbi:MAG: hypothetical protein RLZZ618_1370 [Pseudomonadota bacterium]|jgi:tetratricopeptide (TPR) repeat protein